MKNIFSKPVIQKLLGAATTFRTFPVAMGSALGFTIITIIRINLDWQQQLPYNFLFNCLHWSFALGAIFSLAAITAARSRYDGVRAFRIANIVSVIVIASTFLLLYYLSASYTGLNTTDNINVSNIAAARVSMAIFISMIAFIVLAADNKEQSAIAKSLFMVQKAFVIALIYGVILMVGTSAVAGAFQALIYKNMSYKVYEYLATIVGFFAFAIFVGYFPDFRRGQIDEKREIAQKQPRFVKILFEYIMIPIMLALTVVLLIWSAMKIFSGIDVSFTQLASISASFAIGGIWLSIMVTDGESGLAKFYRKFFPFAGLLILAFEMWALVVQLNIYGMKQTEYIFILLWAVTAISLILLIIMKQKAHIVISAVVCIVAVISVLPFVGYNVLPVKSQLARLENLFESQGMLEENKVVAAKNEPDEATKEDITDAIMYLAYAKDAQLPQWFNKNWTDNNTFKTELGFSLTVQASQPATVKNYGTILNLSSGAIDISGYQWSVNLQQSYESKNAGAFATIKGNKGDYKINWSVDQTNGLPSITLSLNDKIILEQTMKNYIDGVIAKYPLGQLDAKEGTIDDMSLTLQTSQMDIMIVFSNVEINVDNQQDEIHYWLNIKAIYLKER